MKRNAYARVETNLDTTCHSGASKETTNHVPLSVVIAGKRTPSVLKPVGCLLWTGGLHVGSEH